MRSVYFLGWESVKGIAPAALSFYMFHSFRDFLLIPATYVQIFVTFVTTITD